MGNFDDTKPKTAAEDLAYAMEQLGDMGFAMASFVWSFERYLIKSGLWKENAETAQN